LTNKRYTRLP